MIPDDPTVAPLTDLELVRKLITMLQGKNGLHLTNTPEYINLLEHPKFDEAFVIAYQAVYQVAVDPIIMTFIHEAIRAVQFFSDYPRLKA